MRLKIMSVSDDYEADWRSIARYVHKCLWLPWLPVEPVVFVSPPDAGRGDVALRFEVWFLIPQVAFLIRVDYER